MAVTWLAAAFVAAFVMLVFGVLLWLRAADRKLLRLLQTAEALERHAKTTADQFTQFIQPASATVKSVQRQLDSATRVFESARRIGDAADQVADAVSRLSGALSDTTERYVAKAGGKYRRQIADALDWAEIGHAAWQFWQAKRKENSSSSACSDYGEGHDTKD
ncbi:DUF948 domain-containing protein [Paenibacillus sp. sptzw28]|uniref:DUF948 domain-containing protein n=1 Tax=Paenibacillus sp. sptzw28 TaxID=715179 RepID=UPI001C6E3804|nr:DUF948 domain-containing protein [Paenibacillus sp. sptzw28]QYR23323.1 DUF948 domain-containing protein [Paenibacillus sp. sptzw28]